MPRALVDTDIFSEILKGRDETVSARAEANVEESGPYTLSTITILEIIKGLHKAGAEDRIQVLMTRFRACEILSLDLSSAELAGRICADLEKSGQAIGFADPIIAAIAIRSDLTLVTGNVAHYQRIQKLGYPLRLDNWREPLVRQTPIP